MNIRIRDVIDLQGQIHTELVAEPMSIEDLQKLGPAIGRMISNNIQDQANMMAVLKQIYTSAGWQIVYDTGKEIRPSDDELADELLEAYVDEKKESGILNELFQS